MSQQHKAPYLVIGGLTHKLERESKFDEDWLQAFVFEHPLILPVDEIEPAFTPLLPLCRELRTAAGPLDILYINEQGLLTLVECKLWKNPQARREVIGQILDYAQTLSQCNYEELENAVRQARVASGLEPSSIFELADEGHSDEAEFIDRVERNLKRGRFLLLIVGNGIRERTELIANYLQNHAHLNFGFSLVDLSVFRLPDNSTLVHPRVIARTVEIERAVFRVEGSKFQILAPAAGKEASLPRRSSVSEQAFYEALDPRTAARLRSFIEDLNPLGIYPDPGSNSLKLKVNIGDITHNFGVFYTKGDMRNFGIAGTTAEAGQPHVGINYLKTLASFFEGAYVKDTPPENLFHWTVRAQNGYISINESLDRQEAWKTLIAETIEKLEQG